VIFELSVAPGAMADATPREADVDALASEVFRTLAKGSDILPIEEFRKCATILAQLSEDFADESGEAFDRIDLNRDQKIDVREFQREVRNIGGIVGLRKVAGALEEVNRVGQEITAEVQAEEANATMEAQLRLAENTPTRQTTPLRTAGGGWRGATQRPVFGGYPGGGAGGGGDGGLGLALDIKQKPLHKRERGVKQHLRSREKVIENMLQYFAKLRQQYEEQLLNVQEKCHELANKDEVGIRFSPKGPHGLVISSSSVAGADAGEAVGEGGDADGADGSVEGSWNGEGRAATQRDAARFQVEGVEPGSQAESKGIEAGWAIATINGQDYTPKLLAAAQAGEEDYYVIFHKPGTADEQADATKGVFADVQARPTRPKLDAGGIVGEAEDEEEEVEDEDDGEGATGAEEEDEDEEEDEEEEDDDDEDEDEEESEVEEDDDEDDDEEGDGSEAEGIDGSGSSKKASKAKEDEQSSATAQAALADDEQIVAAAAAIDAAAKEAEDKASAEAAAASKAAEEAKTKKPKNEKKPKEKKLKEKKPKKQKSATVRPTSSSSPPPVMATTRSDLVDADKDKDGAEADDAEAAAAPLKVKTGKVKIEEEGVSCLQTLDMDLAIRAAICLGREVWCADWKGTVTIRERDDASKVKSEIPTNRLIWCMGHQEPGLLWMGQESQGISLFHSYKKEAKGALTGGHTGGVNCVCLDEALGDEEDGAFPVRRGWSGSNDFTIRQWWMETWWTQGPTPEKVTSKYTKVKLGKYSMGIAPGMSMHGHTGGVRALIRIGPALWSGSDDSSIRIWYTADGTCTEVIEDAHHGSVLRLVVVRSYVWSAGQDGQIKEWQLGGDSKTRCIRKITPPGYEKGAYAIVPTGKDVWSCGHHPNLRVLSQHGMEQIKELPAHTPYVSNLLAVDRVETRILWSTSIGDKKLKVWRHTIRGNVPSMDELKAANSLYEKESLGGAEKLSRLIADVDELQAQLLTAGEEYTNQLDQLAQQLAEEKAAKDEVEEQRRFLEAELEGLRRLFEEAGLGNLLQDPEALRQFLDVKRLFDEAGLGHLLQDPEALKKFLALGKVLEELGLGHFLSDPEGLKKFLTRAAQIEDVLRSLGLEDCLNDPRKLKEMLQCLKALKKVLEDFGFGDAVKDPSVLTEVLSRHNALKEAFEKNNFSELFEDPVYNLNGFLKNYARVREEFKNVDLEYLMDAAPAMRDFLAKHLAGQEELKELRLLRDKAERLEKTLAKCQRDLAATKAELDGCKTELTRYKEVCPTVEELLKMREEAGQFRTVKKLKKNAEKELEEMRRLLEEKEKERLDALERERIMALKYKELDIFKLDIIARELKALDNELSMVGKTAKALLHDAARLKNFDEKEQITPHGDNVLEQCKDLRAHIRDVIHKCLSETQKMHVGVAIDDHMAAGELKDGGVMAGFVVTEVERPDHGSSKAAKLRQHDEVSREGAKSCASLPQLPPSGRQSPKVFK